MTAKKDVAGDQIVPSLKGDKTATKPRRRGDSSKPRTPERTDSADQARNDKLATVDSAAEKSNAEAKAKRPETADRAKKDKLVRDSFTMPATEYALISQLKKRCLAKGVAAKKSEILRAAIASLATTSDANVLKAIKQLEIIKTGRPSKGKSGA